MDQLENMSLKGKSVSAADKEAWRRWARAGGTKRKRKKRRNRKLPRTSLRPAARVPAVQARDHGGAPVPVHRPSAWHSSCTQRQVGSVHTVLVCGDFTGAAFGQVVVLPVWEQDRSMVETVQITVEIPHAQFLPMVDVPVVVQRQVLWSKQCRTLFGRSQLQFLDKVIDLPVIFNDLCLWRSRQCSSRRPVRSPWRFQRCSSWTSCSCPSLLCLVPMARQRRKTVEIPQVPFLDKVYTPVVAVVPMARQYRKLWLCRSCSYST